MENQPSALTRVLYIERDDGNLDFFGFQSQPIEKTKLKNVLADVHCGF